MSLAKVGLAGTAPSFESSVKAAGACALTAMIVNATTLASFQVGIISASFYDSFQIGLSFLRWNSSTAGFDSPRKLETGSTMNRVFGRDRVYCAPPRKILSCTLQN